MLFEFKTDRRGYTMWLERDLFGDFVLYRRWYGLHNRRCGMKRQVFKDEQQALKAVRRIMRVRERHGYTMVNFRLKDQTTYTRQSTHRGSCKDGVVVI